MHSSRPARVGSSPAALPALLRASHLFGLALGSALGKLRDSGVTAAKMFERAEEQALLLRIARDAPGILGARFPARLTVYRAGLRKKPRTVSLVFKTQPAAISVAPLQGKE